MHPAPSIIFFTVLSGIGFGMLVFLGLGLPPVVYGTAFWFYAIAFGLSVGGLLSSTFHLGHPERALKAFTQWRSSWLSREGVLAVAALLLMGIYAFLAVFFGLRPALLGWIGAALSLATVFATSMIYAQLKTVPRWNHWTTPLLFLLLSLTGGALLTGQRMPALLLLVVAALTALIRQLTTAKAFAQSGSTVASATGLGPIGTPRLFEAPHTGENYLTHEMVFKLGRKHAQKLWVIGMVLAFALPILLLFIAPWPIVIDDTVTMPSIQQVFWVHVASLFAALCHIAGALTLRWLFFAEAEHVVGLYYGRT